MLKSRILSHRKAALQWHEPQHCLLTVYCCCTHMACSGHGCNEGAGLSQPAASYPAELCCSCVLHSTAVSNMRAKHIALVSCWWISRRMHSIPNELQLSMKSCYSPMALQHSSATAFLASAERPPCPQTPAAPRTHLIHCLAALLFSSSTSQELQVLASEAGVQQYSIAALASVRHRLLHLVATQEARLRSCHVFTVARMRRWGRISESDVWQAFNAVQALGRCELVCIDASLLPGSVHQDGLMMLLLL